MSNELIDELDVAEKHRKQQDRFLEIRDYCILTILGSFIVFLVYYIYTRLG